MIRLAYECYADRDVIQFLRVGCRLALQEVHSFSQGEVINAVLVKNIAEVGMVDEDPQSSHHRLRDRLAVIVETQDVQLRRASGKPDRFLIVVKPDLEKCFFASMRRLGLKSKIAEDPSELHRVLGS